MDSQITKSSSKMNKNDSHSRLSMSVENYLLSIFQITEQGVRVTSTSLLDQLKNLPAGEGLGTTLPSVSGMLGRMSREDLILITSDKEILFTDQGLKFAENIVRRHRLAERMVVDILGLDLHKAHVEAHRLEHAISPDLEEKISQKLKNPLTCPFGHPIPGNGYVPYDAVIRLSEASANKRFIVDRVPEEDQVLLEYFVDNHLIPDQIIKVQEVAPYRGVIRLDSRDSKDIVMGYEVASKVWVRCAETI